MARQETIEVILKRAGNYESTVKSLQAEADKLKETFGSIKVGDSVKAIKEQASAATAAAKAEEARAKAAQASAKAVAEEEKANQAILKTIEAESKALQENEKYLQQSAKTQQEAAKAKQQYAKADQETAKIAQERAKVEKETQNAVAARLKVEQEAAKALTAESKMYEQAANASEQRAKREQKVAADIEKAYHQITQAQEQAFNNRGNTAIQNQIDGLLGIGQAAKSAEESMRVFQRTGYFDQLAQQERNTAAAARENAAALREQAREMQQAERSAQRHQQQLDRMGVAVGAVNTQQATSIQYMTEWIHQQQGMANATVTATGAIHNSAGSFQTYNAAVTEAGGVTHNYRFAVENAEGAVYQLDKGIKTTTVSIRDLSSVLRAVRTVIGFTGIAQSLRSAFGEMKDMSDQLAEYRKVTGATVQEMEQIRATAYDIAKAYGESASDVIASAANMARAGYRENSVAMAELATKTKLVGDMTQEAADKFLIAIDAAYKYKGNVEQLSAVLDAANALDNQYATTIEKISDGMTLVASLASTAHVPIEQLMAALGTMTAVTQRSGSETARGLRSIILNVLGDTTTEIEEGVTATEESVKSMTDALLKYGDASVKAAIQAGKVINPMEAIVALQKAWKENQITEQDLYKISNDVAGKRYYNVFTALIQNPEMYNEMLQSIAQSVGSAQSEIDILMDSWSKKLEQLKTTWTELVNKSITEGFIKDLIDGGTAALEFAGSLENLATMASGALVAIRSLSAGITNLRAGNAFGGFNIATTAVGLGITAIGYIKAAYEANQKRIQEEAEQAVQSAVASATTYNSLEELTKRYDEIAKDGIQGEQGELEELKSLQNELNGLVGDQADAIDIVNGKYGDTLVALQKLTEEQRKEAIQAAQSALTTSVAAFNQKDLNGLWFGNTTGIELPNGGNWNKLLSGYEYYHLQNVLGVFGLGFSSSPSQMGAEEIIALLEETEKLYRDITTDPEIANGNSGFITKFAEFYKSVVEIAEPVRKAQENLDSFNEELKGMGESGGSADDATGAIDDLTESVDSLSDSIDKATKAKEKFDDAMKTTKADAFNDYMEAFDTFKGELDAGRVNSTAMYAAARMMLGEDAYNAAGGTYQGVMAAMNHAGSAGSVLDAYNILNTKYQDENGTAVEGFGVYELIRKSGLYSESRLYDKDGNYYLPEMTTDDISRISAAYGGILEEVIINALNALDQYDIYGSATDAGLSVGEKKEEEATAEEEVIDSMKQMTKATDTATESASDLATEMENAAEAAAEFTAAVTTSEGGGRSNKSGTWKETASSIWGGVKDAFAAANEATKAAAAEKTAEAQQKAAEAAQAAADSLDNAISTLNTLNATGGNADIIAMLNGLNNLKETYEIAIEAVGGTGTTEEKLAAIAEALNTVEDEKEIAVSVGLPGTEEGYEAVKAALLAEANGLIDDVDDEDELHDIACTLVADDGTVLNSDIDALLRARQKDVVTVQVEANTAPAILQIGTAEIGKYHAKIGVSADTDDAIEKISGVEEGEYSATVNVDENGAEEAQTAIEDAANGPYNSLIEVSENGATAAKTEIAAAASGPFEATINTSETGSVGAAATIQGVANGPYNATVNTGETGSATVKSTIETVVNTPYNAEIKTSESGSATAKTAITNAANGPYSANIATTESGATEARAEISAASSGPYKAEIATSESGSSAAQAKIQSAADGPYDASVNVSDNGTAAAVQGKIDAITGKDVGITLSVENESGFTSKVDELTKPETKTINIEYNEPPTGTGSAAQNSGPEEEYNNPVGAQEHIPQVPDNLLAGAVASAIDAVFGTDLYDGLAKHDNPEEPPTYDDGYFRPVTQELIEEVNAQREAEEETAAIIAESSDKLESFYNAIQQYGGFFQAVNHGGLNYQSDVLQPYILLRYGVDGLPEGEEITREAIEGFLNEKFGLDEPLEQTIEIDADTSEAKEKADDIVDEISSKHATINVGISSSGGGGVATYTTLDMGGSDLMIKPYKYAVGTSSHPGGISLVNDGNGPELLVDQGRAYIANDGKPALVNLHKNAKVFTASETREILGKGVPAYAVGTKNIALTDGGGTSRTTNYGVRSITAVGTITAVPDETAAQEAASASFSSLKNLIEYVINRIGMAIDEQGELIDKQIAELKANREAIQQQNELEEKRQAVEDALGNRTVRYIDENGQWHWMADANKVQKAQKDLADYEDELAFNAQIQALEDQKTALEEEYKKITKAWSDIQYAVSTPTGDLTQLISQVIATGSATDKKGAETVQNLLITQLLKGGIFSGNYTEALDSIEKATAGNPIMPGESESTLASLIATASGMGTGTEIMEAMKAATMGTIPGVNTSGLAEGGTQIIYNYFINGVQLGSDQATQPLSSIMRNLTVYANTGVVA